MTGTTKILATAIMVGVACFVTLVAIANQNCNESLKLDREMAKIQIVRIVNTSGSPVTRDDIAESLGSGWSRKSIAGMATELVKEGKINSEMVGQSWGGSYTVYSAK